VARVGARKINNTKIAGATLGAHIKHRTQQAANFSICLSGTMAQRMHIQKSGEIISRERPAGSLYMLRGLMGEGLSGARVHEGSNLNLAISWH
jgi:hypothetical protein